MDKVVLDRDEFVRIIAEHADVPSNISVMLRYVESVFVLQSDDDRPVYVFEVDHTRMSVEDFEMLDEGLRYMNVAALLIPRKSLKCLGEVTPQSIGIKDRVDALRKKIRDMFAYMANLGGDDDGR